MERRSVGSMTAGDELLLSNLLEALDDLYDQAPGAEVRVWRLLLATSRAFSGDPSRSEPIDSAAHAMGDLLRGGLSSHELNRRALIVTDEARRVAGAP